MFKTNSITEVCGNCQTGPKPEYKPLTKKDIKVCPWCSEKPKYTKKRLIKPCSCYFEDIEDGVSIYVWNKACQEQLGLICYSLDLINHQCLQQARQALIICNRNNWKES